MVEVGVTNPIPELNRVAIVPFFNLSQERTADGRRFALAYFSELQKVPGFQVVPVGVVEQAIYDNNLQMNGPEDALKLAKILNVDIVVVGAITDYDPYYPPRIGWQVSWYSPYAPSTLAVLERKSRSHFFKFKLRNQFLAGFSGRTRDSLRSSGLVRAQSPSREAAFTELVTQTTTPETRTTSHLTSVQDGSSASALAPTFQTPTTTAQAERSPNFSSSNTSSAVLNGWYSVDELKSKQSENADTSPDFPRKPTVNSQDRQSLVVDQNESHTLRRTNGLVSSANSACSSSSALRDSTTLSQTGTSVNTGFFKTSGAAEFPQRGQEQGPCVEQQEVSSSHMFEGQGRSYGSEESKAAAPPRFAMPSEDDNGTFTDPLARQGSTSQAFWVDRNPLQPLMSYTRLFDGADPDLVAKLRDYVELSGDRRSGGWEAYLHRSEDFIRFTAHLMIVEMLSLHGGETRHRFIFKLRKQM